MCIANRVLLLILDRVWGSHLEAFLKGLLDFNWEPIYNFAILWRRFRSAGGACEVLTRLWVVVCRLSCMGMVAESTFLFR